MPKAESLQETVAFGIMVIYDGFITQSLFTLTIHNQRVTQLIVFVLFWHARRRYVLAPEYYSKRGTQWQSGF